MAIATEEVGVVEVVTVPADSGVKDEGNAGERPAVDALIAAGVVVVVDPEKAVEIVDAAGAVAVAMRLGVEFREQPSRWMMELGIGPSRQIHVETNLP